MVQKIQVGEKAESNGDREHQSEYVGFGENHAMSFDMKDVIDLAVEGVTFDNRDKSLNGAFWCLMP